MKNKKEEKTCDTNEYIPCFIVLPGNGMVVSVFTNGTGDMD